MSLNNAVGFLTDKKIKFLQNESMKNHTTFKIGGAADILAFPKSTSEMCELLSFCNNGNIPVTVIGRGSNLLVSDSGIEGIVISTAELTQKSLVDFTVTAGAGANLTALCSFAADNALSGLEFAFGIPASVGGAVFMNAGAYGGEIADVISSVTAITKNGQIKTYKKEDLCLGYRQSVFKQNGEVIIEAAFTLKKSNSNKIRAAMADFMQRRHSKQPLEYPSAGSTFKRPEGYFAGALIEQAGLKGMSVGDAEVSEKHAGFIINKGSASCSDVLSLISKIKAEILKKNNVELEPEVIFIGRGE